MASLTLMSYAEMVFATVPAAPPTWKNRRATSCPAPISAKVPYFLASRLIWSALWLVSILAECMSIMPFTEIHYTLMRKLADFSTGPRFFAGTLFFHQHQQIFAFHR